MITVCSSFKVTKIKMLLTVSNCFILVQSLSHEHWVLGGKTPWMGHEFTAKHYSACPHVHVKYFFF